MKKRLLLVLVVVLLIVAFIYGIFVMFCGHFADYTNYVQHSLLGTVSDYKDGKLFVATVYKILPPDKLKDQMLTIVVGVPISDKFQFTLVEVKRNQQDVTDVNTLTSKLNISSIRLYKGCPVSIDFEYKYCRFLVKDITVVKGGD
ncbi:MAG: hypothetical protein QXP36_02425 [Conexivisphaerales archaeon]